MTNKLEGYVAENKLYEYIDSLEILSKKERGEYKALIGEILEKYDTTMKNRKESRKNIEKLAQDENELKEGLKSIIQVEEKLDKELEKREHSAKIVNGERINYHR